MLGPHDAVNGLGGRIAYGAAGEGLGGRLGRAVVTLGEATLDERHLAEVARRAALDERHVGRQTQAVDVRARRLVVERVEHEREALEVVDVEACVEDAVVVGHNVGVRVVLEHGLARNDGFRLAHVLLLKEELTIQVAEFDCVQVNLTIFINNE